MRSGSLSALIAATRPVRKRALAGLGAVLFVLVLALLALVLLQVLTRYVMQAAIPWTEEVARMVLVWMVMVGATIAAERNEHYAINFLSAKLRGVPRLLVLLLTNVMGLIFLLVLAVYGTQYVLANLQTVYVSTQTTKALVYVALPGGAVLMALSLVLQSIEAWIAGPDAATQAGVVMGDV